MKKDFFIGVDSDGTAFNSMIAKHRYAFIPAAIEVWSLEEYSNDVFEFCEYINLFSKHRGINRFEGLLMMFDELKTRGIFLGDYSALREYMNNTNTYSNSTLKKYIEDTQNPFLEEVLKWSMKADILFAEKVNGMPPFDGVKESLEEASKYADVVVVSSASAKGLLDDWGASDIAKYTHKIMGQENGTKKQQLKNAVGNEYSENCVLMIGDAIGDYDAAQSVDALFYPILPGREEESWHKFLETGMKKFFEGSFAGEYQKDLLKEFFDILS